MVKPTNGPCLKAPRASKRRSKEQAPMQDGGIIDPCWKNSFLESIFFQGNISRSAWEKGHGSESAIPPFSI